MTKEQNLEDSCQIPGEVIPGELNQITGKPKHAIHVPKDCIPDKGFELYCCDSRKNECVFLVNYKGMSYCTYSKD